MAVYEEETSNFKGQNERIERFLELDSYSYSYYYDEDEDLFYLSFGIICKLNLIVGFLLQICADAKDDPLRFAYEKVYSGAFVPNGRTRELNYCVSTSPGNKSDMIMKIKNELYNINSKQLLYYLHIFQV